MVFPLYPNKVFPTLAEAHTFLSRRPRKQNRPDRAPRICAFASGRKNPVKGR
jgi:hypothetical protein